MVIVSGSSGVGKTSLINVAAAGLAEAARVLPVGRVRFGSAFPTAALREHNPYLLALLGTWLPAESPARLVGTSLSDVLRRHLPWTGAEGDELPVFAAIDQFEELFGGPASGRAFQEQVIEGLAEAMRWYPGLHLVLGVRQPAVADVGRLADRLGVDDVRQLELEPLTTDAAIEAVVAPVTGTAGTPGTGRRYAAGVAERLVHDLRESRAGTDRIEPALLQVVCSALWRSLPDGVATISNVARDHVDRALTAFCAGAVAEVALEHRLPSWELLDWVTRTFLDESGDRARVRRGTTDTNGMPNSIPQALEDRWVLKAHAHAGRVEYTLASARLAVPMLAAHQVPDQPGREASPDELLRKAADALSRGMLEQAARYAEEAVQASSDHDARAAAEGESVLGNLAYYRGQLEVATAHHRRAAAYFEALQDPTAAGLQLAAIGRLLGASGSYSEALRVLQAAVTRLGGSYPVQVEFARALWSAGQLDAATAVLSTVLSLMPDEAQALADRGQISVDRDDPVSALEDLDSLDRLRPDIGRRADVRAARALALARLSRKREARAEAAAALADGHDNGPALLRASGVARAVGETNRAALLLRMAEAARQPELSPYQRSEAHRLLAELTAPGPTS